MDSDSDQEMSGMWLNHASFGLVGRMGRGSHNANHARIALDVVALL
jgi:hypothetical protein